MRIYLKNNPAKFYPDSISNDDGALKPVHTVAEKCNCRRCLADSLTFLRQSHFYPDPISNDEALGCFVKCRPNNKNNKKKKKSNHNRKMSKRYGISSWSNNNSYPMHAGIKPATHEPSWRAVVTARQDGPSRRLPWHTSRHDGPSRPVMTGRRREPSAHHHPRI